MVTRHDHYGPGSLFLAIVLATMDGNGMGGSRIGNPLLPRSMSGPCAHIVAFLLCGDDACAPEIVGGTAVWPTTNLRAPVAGAL
jgi:hypothetical protein